MTSKKSLPSTHSATDIERANAFRSFASRWTPALIDNPNLTPERAILSNSAPVLSQISRDYGRNSATAWLIGMLNKWQMAMPVQGKMPATQLQFLAENIAREFFYLKASEFILFLRQLMGGRFTVSWYGQLNPDTFTDALRNQFLAQREQVIHQVEVEKATRHHPHHPISWEEYCARHNISRESPLASVHLPSLDEPSHSQ